MGLTITYETKAMVDYETSTVCLIDEKHSYFILIIYDYPDKKAVTRLWLPNNEPPLVFHLPLQETYTQLALAIRDYEGE